MILYGQLSTDVIVTQMADSNYKKQVKITSIVIEKTHLLFTNKKLQFFYVHLFQTIVFQQQFNNVQSLTLAANFIFFHCKSTSYDYDITVRKNQFPLGNYNVKVRGSTLGGVCLWVPYSLEILSRDWRFPNCVLQDLL